MPITLTKAIHDFFGKKPNQPLGEFQNEIRALTPQDREYFVREFAKVGIEVEVVRPTA